MLIGHSVGQKIAGLFKTRLSASNIEDWKFDYGEALKLLFILAFLVSEWVICHA